MVAAADLISLYRRQANVWVEDKLTSEYLSEVWKEPRVLFLIGGSAGGIRPVVKDARESGATNVFGIVDRDFEATNVGNWQDPQVTTFVLPSHEMENFLLDEDALANCDLNTRNRTVEEIRNRMHSKATSLLPWMTTIAVMKQIRCHLLDEFMPRPRPMDLNTIADCWPRIQASPWYQSINARSSDVCNQHIVQTWLNQSQAQFQADLATDNWKVSFSGKEIFRDVRGYIYQPTEAASPAVHDVDLAKSIAIVHGNGTTDPKLLGLRDLIRQRCGI